MRILKFPIILFALAILLNACTSEEPVYENNSQINSSHLDFEGHQSTVNSVTDTYQIGSIVEAFDTTVNYARTNEITDEEILTNFYLDQLEQIGFELIEITSDSLTPSIDYSSEFLTLHQSLSDISNFESWEDLYGNINTFENSVVEANLTGYEKASMESTAQPLKRVC
jgi:hypothetical protein